jgi:hypothetical protein
MHAMRGLLLLGLGLLHGASALRVRSDGSVENPVVAGSKTFIVELAKGCDVERVKRKLRQQSAGTVVLKTFQSDFFTGISVETTDNTAESLQGLADAVRAWPMRKIDQPSPEHVQSFSSDAKAPESKSIRTELDALYTYITDVAFAHQVLNPTSELARYIRDVNDMIAEVNAAYNQRMGQTKAQTESVPVPPPTTEPDSGTTPEPEPTPDPEPTPTPTPDNGEDDDDGGLAG